MAAAGPKGRSPKQPKRAPHGAGRAPAPIVPMPEKEMFRVSGLDIATLLALVVQGARREDVGFENADSSLDRLKKILSGKHQKLRQSTLEGLLWSANLMEEAGAFWSPVDDDKDRFDNFVKRILRDSGHNNVGFDRRFNLIVERKKK